MNRRDVLAAVPVVAMGALLAVLPPAGDVPPTADAAGQAVEVAAVAGG